MRKFGKVRQVCKLMGVNSREISDFRKIKCGEKLWRWFTSVFFPTSLFQNTTKLLAMIYELFVKISTKITTHCVCLKNKNCHYPSLLKFSEQSLSINCVLTALPLYNNHYVNVNSTVTTLIMENIEPVKTFNHRTMRDRINNYGMYPI